MTNKIKSLYRFLSPRFHSVHLEYKVNVKARYGQGSPAHSLLYEIINSHRNVYKSSLESFLKYSENIQLIQNFNNEKDENNPSWNNGFLPGLDIVSLYGIIADYKPKRYLEIGSGFSTKVARKSIKENSLNTEVISIDPYPRANIDHLADKVIREPFENLSDNKFIVDSLHENDILFIDNSHCVFPNSDAMICFLELMPFLRKGVIVHFHDIYLPYDYPQFMCDRYYNEQYVLATYLMANPEKFRPIMPNFFVSEDTELSKIISPIWQHPNLVNVEKHGGSFWLRIN